MSGMNSISEQITTIRKAAGVSQEELAALLGKTTGAICNYEKGRRPIRATDFEKIKIYCSQVSTGQGAKRP